MLGLLAAWLCGLAAVLFILAWVIIALATTVRMRVPVPLCREHRNHWTWRLGYIYTGTGFFAIVGLTALVYVIVQARKDDASELIGFLCALPAGIGIAWLISAAVIQNGTIRATEIRDRRITLCRVSPAFVKAIEAADALEEEEFRRQRGRAIRKDEEGIYDPETGGKYRKLPRDANREEIR